MLAAQAPPVGVTPALALCPLPQDRAGLTSLGVGERRSSTWGLGGGACSEADLRLGSLSRWFTKVLCQGPGGQ